MNSIEVTNINELMTNIDDLIRRTNGRLWFRGHTNAEWDLLPAVRRGYTSEQEKYLTNEFRVRAGTRYHNCPDEENYSDWGQFGTSITK